MKPIRSAVEAEVVAEFLKNEYHTKEYHVDRDQYESLVFEGDLANREQNEIRRTLLLRRHRGLWNKLPRDIRWLLVQLELDDLQKMKVSSAGHFSRLADGSELTLLELADKIRDHRFSSNTNSYISKIQALAYRMRKSPLISSIILVGLDAEQSMTILDGNQRMLAAALISAERTCAFRAYVGLSPNMNDCNWYGANNDISLMNAWQRVRNMQPRLTAAMKSFAFSIVSE